MGKIKELAPSRHSTTVGGSTAARVMACPGSVKLVQTVPAMPTTDYAREGSMLHAAIAAVIEQNLDPQEMLGFKYEGLELTQELMDEKLLPAVQMLDDILDELEDEYNDTATIVVESEVDFGKAIPDAFGSCDIIFRVGDRVVVLDWKFGSNTVSAEANKQLMFYACAAMHTQPKLFEDATDVELVIVQPAQGAPSRWVTTAPELTRFERELKAAVKEAEKPNAKLMQGNHCRWCAAQPICPLMNGAMDRAVQADLSAIDVNKLGLAVQQSYILEDFIKKLRSLVQFALEEGKEVPGCKLVQKKATRKWRDEEQVSIILSEQLTEEEMFERKLKSPAQMEKVLKDLPEDLIVKESSGTTLVLDSDPRPAVTTTAALGKALNKIK